MPWTRPRRCSSSSTRQRLSLRLRRARPRLRRTPLCPDRASWIGLRFRRRQCPRSCRRALRGSTPRCCAITGTTHCQPPTIQGSRATWARSRGCCSPAPIRRRAATMPLLHQAPRTMRALDRRPHRGAGCRAAGAPLSPAAAVTARAQGVPAVPRSGSRREVSDGLRDPQRRSARAPPRDPRPACAACSASRGRCARSSKRPAPSRRWRLLDHGGVLPHAEEPLRLDPVVVSWLFGQDAALTADPRLSPFVRRRPWAGATWLGRPEESTWSSGCATLMVAEADDRRVVLAPRDKNGSRAALEAAARLADVSAAPHRPAVARPVGPRGDCRDFDPHLARAARLLSAVPVIDTGAQTAEGLGAQGLTRLLRRPERHVAAADRRHARRRARRPFAATVARALHSD